MHRIGMKAPLLSKIPISMISSIKNLSEGTSTSHMGILPFIRILVSSLKLPEVIGISKEESYLIIESEEPDMQYLKIIRWTHQLYIQIF